MASKSAETQAEPASTRPGSPDDGADGKSHSQRGDAEGTLHLEMARLAVLGINAWLVTLVLPMLSSSPRTLAAFGLLLIPLAPLVAGIPVLAWSRPLSAWLLVGGFPTLVAAVAAATPNVASRWPWSTPGMLVAVVSIVAFGAAAAWSGSRPRRFRASTHRPLSTPAPTDLDARRRLVRRALLGATGLFGILVVVVAPGVGDAAGREATWGVAAPEAATLTTVVAGAIAAAVLAAFVGPALRASRARLPTRRQVRRRVAGLLFSVAVGIAFITFYALSAR